VRGDKGADDRRERKRKGVLICVCVCVFDEWVAMGSALSMNGGDEQSDTHGAVDGGGGAGSGMTTGERERAHRSRHQLWNGLSQGSWRLGPGGRGGGSRLRRSGTQSDAVAGSRRSSAGEGSVTDRASLHQSRSLSISSSWRRRKLRRAWFSGEHEPARDGESGAGSSRLHSSAESEGGQLRGSRTAFENGSEASNTESDDVELVLAMFTPAVESSECNESAQKNAHSSREPTLGCLQPANTVPSLAELCLRKVLETLSDEDDHEFRCAATRSSLEDVPFGRLAPDVVQSVVSSVVDKCKMRTAQGVLAEIGDRGCAGVSRLKVRQRNYLGEYSPTDALLVPVSQFSHSLERLDLRGALFITDAAMPFLACAKELVYLDLSGCVKLSSVGCRFLSCLSKLQTLKLSALPQLDELAVLAISHMSDLRVLHIDRCSLVDDDAIHHLSQLTKCRELVLAHCFQLTDSAISSVVANMPHLAVLDVTSTHAGSEMIDSLRTAGTLSKLEVLRVSGCFGIHDRDGAEWVNELTSLRELNVARTAVSDALVRRLRGKEILEILDLSFTNVSDRPLVDTLPTLTRLERLCLESCELISDFVLEAGVCHLEKLAELDVSDTAISSHGLSGLRTLKKLHVLNIARTLIADHALDNVCGLEHLAQLDLDCVSITDDALRRVGGLKSLRDLALFSSRISDHGLEFLLPLQELRSLEVCSGILTNAGLANIARLSALESLSVAHNARVGSSGVSHLAPLAHLRQLNVGFTSVNDDLVSLMCHRHSRGFTSLRAIALNGCTRLSQRARRRLAAVPWLSVIGAEVKPPELPILPPPPALARLPMELEEDDDVDAEDVFELAKSAVASVGDVSCTAEIRGAQEQGDFEYRSGGGGADNSRGRDGFARESISFASLAM